MAMQKRMRALDMLNIANNLNTTATTYGTASRATGVQSGQKMMATNVHSLYTVLQECNSHTYNSTPLNLSDLLGVKVGDLINDTILDLIDSRATSIRASYCACNCNQCSCNCARCSCNCNRCTCDCNRCACDVFAVTCTCNCNKP